MRDERATWKGANYSKLIPDHDRKTSDALDYLYETSVLLDRRGRGGSAGKQEKRGVM